MLKFLQKLFYDSVIEESCELTCMNNIIDKKSMWEHFVNADLSRVTATGEWDNVWRCSAKTLPTLLLLGLYVLYVLLGPFAAHLSVQFVSSRSKRGLERVMGESKQYTIKKKFPPARSQPFNLTRSLNDTTVYLNLLLLLPGRADSEEYIWLPPSCSTPASQQEKICGLSPQLVKISAFPIELLEQLCISPA